MNCKHKSVPWYGTQTTQEATQAQAMLDVIMTSYLGNDVYSCHIAGNY